MSRDITLGHPQRLEPTLLQRRPELLQELRTPRIVPERNQCPDLHDPTFRTVLLRWCPTNPRPSPRWPL